MASSTSVIMILLSLSSTVFTRPQGPTRCSSAADIIFILDSSRSIWEPDFKKQTLFVSQIIDNFDIGPGPSQTRVGVVTFGHDVWKKFDLKDIMDKDKMMRTVKDIKHDNGKMTNTGDAIAYAVKNMFTPQAGNRPKVPRIAVVITDGHSQNTQKTRNAAEKAHDSGITVFAIGVGKNLDFGELGVIASDPDTEYMFQVSGYTTLSTITEKLTDRTCKATKAPVTASTTAETTTTAATTTTTTTTTTPATTASTETTTTPDMTTPTTPFVTRTTTETKSADQPQKDCSGKPADVFFVIDSSGSIARKDFNKEINFVKKVVKAFDINNDTTRVGVITFSTKAEIILGLNNGLSKDQLITKIDTIKHAAQGTNTAEALKLMRETGFSQDIVRPNIPKIAIFLTDGLSRDEKRTAKEANLTHDAGITVFSIGIGDGIDLIEIRRIASDPDDSFVFQVDDFNSLDSIKDALAIKTCSVKPNDVNEKPAVERACEVTKNTDLMFIYDITSLGKEKSTAVSVFLSAVVSKFDLLSGYLHVGRITDNCPTDVNFQLSSKITSSDFSKIRLPTFSHMIKKVALSGFTPEYGARKDSAKVSVLFIDAEMDSLDNKALHEAKNLANNTELFVVAMGHNHIIHQFSKSFDKNHFIHLNSFRDLDGAVEKTLDKLCHYFQTSFIEIPPFTIV